VRRATAGGRKRELRAKRRPKAAYERRGEPPETRKEAQKKRKVGAEDSGSRRCSGAERDLKNVWKFCRRTARGLVAVAFLVGGRRELKNLFERYRLGDSASG